MYMYIQGDSRIPIVLAWKRSDSGFVFMNHLVYYALFATKKTLKV